MGTLRPSKPRGTDEAVRPLAEQSGAPTPAKKKKPYRERSVREMEACDLDPRGVLKQRTLLLRKTILFTLATYVNGTSGLCWPSMEAIAPEVLVSLPTLRKELKAMEQDGLIIMTRREGTSYLFDLICIAPDAVEARRERKAKAESSEGRGESFQGEGKENEAEGRKNQGEPESLKSANRNEPLSVTPIHKTNIKNPDLGTHRETKNVEQLSERLEAVRAFIDEVGTFKAGSESELLSVSFKGWSAKAIYAEVEKVRCLKAARSSTPSNSTPEPAGVTGDPVAVAYTSHPGRGAKVMALDVNTIARVPWGEVPALPKDSPNG